MVTIQWNSDIPIVDGYIYDLPSSHLEVRFDAGMTQDKRTYNTHTYKEIWFKVPDNLKIELEINGIKVQPNSPNQPLNSNEIYYRANLLEDNIIKIITTPKPIPEPIPNMTKLTIKCQDVDNGNDVLIEEGYVHNLRDNTPMHRFYNQLGTYSVDLSPEERVEFYFRLSLIDGKGFIVQEVDLANDLGYSHRSIVGVTPNDRNIGDPNQWYGATDTEFKGDFFNIEIRAKYVDNTTTPPPTPGKTYKILEMQLAGFLPGALSRLTVTKVDEILATVFNFLPLGWTISKIEVSGSTMRIHIIEEGTDPITIATIFTIIKAIGLVMILLGLIVTAWKFLDYKTATKEAEAVADKKEVAELIESNKDTLIKVVSDLDSLTPEAKERLIQLILKGDVDSLLGGDGGLDWQKTILIVAGIVGASLVAYAFLSRRSNG